MTYEYSDISKYDFHLLASLGKARGTTASARFMHYTLPTANVEYDLSGVQISGTPSFTWPSSASTLKVSSSSANDSAAGTGMRTILLVGVDSSFENLTEIVTLNGQTPVETTSLFLRVTQIRGLTCGSGGSNIGNIHVYLSSETSVLNGVPQTQALRQLILDAGEGLDSSLCMTIPACCYSFVNRLSASMIGGANNEAIIRVYGRENVESVISPWLLYFELSLKGGGTSHISEPFALQAGWDPKTDIKITATADYTANLFIRYESFIVDKNVI